MANWIKSEDSLPPQGEEVLGFDNFYERIGIAIRDNSRLIFVDSDDCYITHWMKLPEKPAEGA